MNERSPLKTCVHKCRRPNEPRVLASERIRRDSIAEHNSKSKEAHQDQPAVWNRKKRIKMMHTVDTSQNEEVIDAYMVLDIEYDHNDTIVMMKATADKESMYYHQAMKQKDRSKFVSALNNEPTSLESSKTYTVRKRSDLPSGTKILPMVWQMRQKRKQATGDIKKYKARLNVDGSQIQK